MELITEENFSPERVVRPLTAAALILAALVLLLGLGLAAGYQFFWNTYDHRDKLQHDLQSAKDNVNAHPDDVQGRLALGWMFLQNGQTDQALEQYQNALKLDPGNQTARYNIALVKIDRKDLQGARQDLEQVQKDNPQYLAARYTLGIVCRQMGDFSLALQELQLVNALQPGHVDVLEELAQTYAKSGDKAKAREFYRQALSYAPKDGTIEAALAALNKG